MASDYNFKFIFKIIVINYDFNHLKKKLKPQVPNFVKLIYLR